MTSIGQILKKYIPGGAHTYAKGDDAWPTNAPECIVKGRGAFVWDDHRHRYIDWGMGLTSVAFGHADPEIDAAVKKAMSLGRNFSRPSRTEAIAAMTLVEHLRDRGEMVKFGKNGSDATDGAARLARAYTGRDLVAYCNQPFFGSSDSYIGGTACNAGILPAVAQASLRFKYNDPESVLALFERYPGRIAALFLEPMRFHHPAPGFLSFLRTVCDAHGTLLVFDEMISGFKFHARGASAYFGATADLYCWGKSLANGYSVSALTGSREVMERAGLEHGFERVFLMSATHGAEVPPLVAMTTVIDRVQRDPGMFERNRKKGRALRSTLNGLIEKNGLAEGLGFVGDDCHFAVAFRQTGTLPPAEAKTFLLQELVRRGQLFSGSFFPTIAHDFSILHETIGVWEEVLPLYVRFLDGDRSVPLLGPAVQPVLRRFNRCGCMECSAVGTCKAPVPATIRAGP